MWLAASLALACSHRSPHLLLDAGARDLDDLLRRHPMADEANIRADEIGRMPGATVHLVQVRSAEAPHRHDHHDMVVTVLRGHGVLRTGDAEHPMRTGDVAVVRRGEPHWFTSRAGERPSVALVVFTPPLDAPDMTPLDVDSLRPAR
jgi:mannose-6-phosphate isomerase-like protein (cupin superfamily)